MNLILTIFAFVLAVLYAVTASVYAFRLSRKVDDCNDWYALLLNVQQHAMIGAELKHEVKSKETLPEYVALKRIIRVFYSTFIPVVFLAFITSVAEW